MRKRRILTPLNEERVRLDIIKDLIVFDLLICRPVSITRNTRKLASVKTRSLAMAEAPTEHDATVTMATEPATAK